MVTMDYRMDRIRLVVNKGAASFAPGAAHVCRPRASLPLVASHFVTIRPLRTHFLHSFTSAFNFFVQTASSSAFLALDEHVASASTAIALASAPIANASVCARIAAAHSHLGSRAQWFNSCAAERSKPTPAPFLFCRFVFCAFT